MQEITQEQILDLHQQFKQLQTPNQEGEFDIDQSKAVITWVAQLVAEVVDTVRAKDTNGTKITIINVIIRFGDDLAGLLSIINRFQQITNEVGDIDKQEALELMGWTRQETERTFSKKGLLVDDGTTQKVIDVVAWLVEGVDKLTSF